MARRSRIRRHAIPAIREACRRVVGRTHGTCAPEPDRSALPKDGHTSARRYEHPCCCRCAHRLGGLRWGRGAQVYGHHRDRVALPRLVASICLENAPGVKYVLVCAVARRKQSFVLNHLEDSVADSHTRMLSHEPSYHGLAPVGGFLSLATHELFRFRDFRLGRDPKRYYSLGRSERCDIVLRDKRVSSVHAFVERIDGDTYILRDNQSLNGVYAFRGGRVDKVTATLLTVGLAIGIGETTLITVTQEGRAPLMAFTVSEFEREAYRVYGSLQAAGKAIGKSHQTIARALTRLRKRMGAGQPHE